MGKKGRWIHRNALARQSYRAAAGRGRGAMKAEGGTTVAPQGADSEEEISDVKTGTKRGREFQRRTGCRRSRTSVIESDEDDENVELVRRGVTKVDCKRWCGDSSFS